MVIFIFKKYKNLLCCKQVTYEEKDCADLTTYLLTDILQLC